MAESEKATPKKELPTKFNNKKGNGLKKKLKKSKFGKYIYGSWVFLIICAALIPSMLLQAILEQFLLFCEDPVGYLKQQYEEFQKEEYRVLSGYAEYDYEDAIPMSEAEICAVFKKEIEKVENKNDRNIYREVEKLIDNFDLDRDISMTSFKAQTYKSTDNMYAKIMAMYSLSPTREGPKTLENLLKEIEAKKVYNKVTYTIHEAQVTIPEARTVCIPSTMVVKAGEGYEPDDRLVFEYDGEYYIKYDIYIPTDKVTYYYEDTENVETYKPLGIYLPHYFASYDSEGNVTGVDTVDVEIYCKTYEDINPEIVTKKYLILDVQPNDEESLARQFQINLDEIPDLDVNDKDEDKDADENEDDTKKKKGAGTYRELIEDQVSMTGVLMGDIELINNYSERLSIPYSTLLKMVDFYKGLMNEKKLSKNRVVILQTALSLQGCISYDENNNTITPGWNDDFNDRYTDGAELKTVGLDSAGYLQWVLMTAAANKTSLLNDDLLFASNPTTMTQNYQEIRFDDLKPGDIGILHSSLDNDSVIIGGELGVNDEDYTYDKGENIKNEHTGEQMKDENNIVAIFLASDEMYLYWIGCTPVTKTVSILRTYNKQSDAYKAEQLENLQNNGLTESLNRFYEIDDYNDIKDKGNIVEVQHVYRFGKWIEDDTLELTHPVNYTSKVIDDVNKDTLLLAQILDYVCARYESLPKQGTDARIAVAEVIMNNWRLKNSQCVEGVSFDIDEIIFQMAIDGKLTNRYVDLPREQNDFLNEILELISGEDLGIYKGLCSNCANYHDEYKEKILKLIKDYRAGIGLTDNTVTLRELAIAQSALKGERQLLPSNAYYFNYYRFSGEETNATYQTMYEFGDYVYNDEHKMMLRNNKALWGSRLYNNYGFIHVYTFDEALMEKDRKNNYYQFYKNTQTSIYDQEGDQSPLNGKNILSLTKEEKNYVIDNFGTLAIRDYFASQSDNDIESFYNSLTDDENERLTNSLDKYCFVSPLESLLK